MRTTNRLHTISLTLLALLAISCGHAHLSDSPIADEEESYPSSHQDTPVLEWKLAGRFFGYEIYTATTTTGEERVKLERYCDDSCENAKRRLNIIMGRLYTALAEPTTPALTTEAQSIYSEADSARKSYQPEQMEETMERVQELIGRIEAEKRRMIRDKLRICLGVGLLVAGLFALEMRRRRRNTANIRPEQTKTVTKRLAPSDYASILLRGENVHLIQQAGEERNRCIAAVLNHLSTKKAEIGTIIDLGSQQLTQAPDLKSAYKKLTDFIPKEGDERQGIEAVERKARQAKNGFVIVVINADKKNCPITKDYVWDILFGWLRAATERFRMQQITFAVFVVGDTTELHHSTCGSRFYSQRFNV